MDTDQTTPFPEDRGAGGKFREPPPRKPPSTPYAHAPETTRRRWISKLVDPAYRLIAGGANRILPSFLTSAAAPAPALPGPSSATEDQGKWKTGEQVHTDDGHKNDLQLPESDEMASTGDISGEMTSSSDFGLHKQNKKGKQSEKNRLSDIEQLVKGNKFSREEFNRLVEVLNSRAMELPNVEQGREDTNLTSRKDQELFAVGHRLPKASNEQRHEQLSEAIWGHTTPLGLSKGRDEIGASPIEIARAYMGSRAPETGLSSKNIVQTVENMALSGNESAIKPYDPSPLTKSSTCWPGAVVQDAYVTPQSQRGRYGLHNFPRTPYTRTLLSKSKSRLAHMQGNHGLISSTLLRQSQTSLYLEDKSKADATERRYGSVGPIHRTRHKVVTQSSSRRPVYSSLNGTSWREISGVNEGFTPDVTKSSNPDGTSSIHRPMGFEVGVPTVPMHTSLMAKKILEHIDRNVPTPKEKSAELRLATAWKKPESTLLSNDDNGLLKSKDISPYKYDGLDGMKFTLTEDGQGNFNVDKSEDVRKEGTSAFEVNVSSSIPRQTNDERTTQTFGGFQNSLLKPTGEDALKTLPSGGNPFVINHEKKPISNSSVSKPVLPPIAITKPVSAQFDNSSGFTFPVSASTSVFSEPPTPSIMPLFSTGDHHSKERSSEQSFSFGLKRSSPGIVFSFPSTSNTAVDNGDGEIKFNFGSNKKNRLSFSFGNNVVCC